MGLLNGSLACFLGQNMAQNTYNVDLSTAEGFNLIKDNRGLWSARPALKVVHTTTDTKILYAFSVASAAGAVYHYVFSLTSANIIHVKIFDDQFIELGSKNLDACRDPSSPVTHAVAYNQIIINSPGWSAPYHCFIGSTPKVAKAVPSTDIDQDTVELFPGLVCSFGGGESARVCWAFRNQVFINDPGEELRTLTATNLIPVTGTVLDMFTAPQGNLIIVTSDGMYDLPPDGLAGSSFQGQVVRTTNFSGLSSRNACASRLGVYGLVFDGLLDIRSTQMIPLTTYKRARKITEPVGSGLASDFRVGKLFSFADGVMISFGEDQPFCLVNMSKNYTTWWKEDSVNNDIVGILQADDGTQLIAFSDRIAAIYGDSPNCTFGLAVEHKLNGFVSHRVTDVIVTATGNGSGTVRTYLRGSDSTKTTKITPNASIATDSGGTATKDTWGTAKVYDAEMCSVRAQRAVRTDGLYFEVGITRDMSIQSVVIVTNGQGKNRHR